MSTTIIGPVITASALLLGAVIGDAEATIIGAAITAIATVLTAVITSVWVRHRERKPPEIGEQVRKVEEENDELDKVTSDEDPPDKIIEIVEYSLGKPRDVWGKLLMIRMALRRLLRSTADAHGIRFSRETTGIMTMNDRLKEKGIIDKDLHDVIETVRDATFTAEWGIGKEAHPEDVRFTLENYGEVFAQLKENMRSTRPTL